MTERGSAAKTAVKLSVEHQAQPIQTNTMGLRCAGSLRSSPRLMPASSVCSKARDLSNCTLLKTGH